MPDNSSPPARQVSFINEIQSLSNKKAYSIEIYSFSNGKFDVQKNIPTIKFPAFITDFTDSYKSNWNTQEVYGRMDPIATFKNTSRTISLAFDMPNDSLQIAKQNLKQIDFLIRGLYPVYDEGTKGTAVIISPPMFRVRFANLVRNNGNDDDSAGTLRSGLLCYINNFDFKPKIDSGFFSDEDKRLFPKLISVTLNLNIIHEHPLGNKKSGSTTVPRINFENFPHEYTEKPKADTSKTTTQGTTKQVTNDKDANAQKAALASACKQ